MSLPNLHLNNSEYTQSGLSWGQGIFCGCVGPLGSFSRSPTHILLQLLSCDAQVMWPVNLPSKKSMWHKRNVWYVSFWEIYSFVYLIPINRGHPYGELTERFLKISVLQKLSAGWQYRRKSSQQIHRLSIIFQTLKNF